MAALYKVCPDDGTRNTPGSVECSSCGRVLHDVELTGVEPAPSAAGAGAAADLAPPARCTCLGRWYGPGSCPTCTLAPHESAPDAADPRLGEAQHHFSLEPRSDFGDPGPERLGGEDGPRERGDGIATGDGKAEGDTEFVVALPGQFRVSSSTLMLLGRSCEATPTQIGQYLRHNPGVSRTHCLIVSGAGSLLIYDLASTNGTFVDNCRVLPGAARRITYDELPVSLGLGQGMVCTIERRL